jgi:hypothetical protein
VIDPFYYSWKSIKYNTVFKRGVALVFARSSKYASEVCEALKTLEYQPKVVDISKTEKTLESSNILINRLNKKSLIVTQFQKTVSWQTKDRFSWSSWALF